MADWDGLAAMLARATGADAALDQAIATAFAVTATDFTASVGAARALAAEVLPGWKLHVGYDANGMFPYSAMTLGEVHVEANAPTVPLAILRAAVAATMRQPPAPAP